MASNCATGQTLRFFFIVHKKHNRQNMMQVGKMNVAVLNLSQLFEVFCAFTSVFHVNPTLELVLCSLSFLLSVLHFLPFSKWEFGSVSIIFYIYEAAIVVCYPAFASVMAFSSFFCPSPIAFKVKFLFVLPILAEVFLFLDEFLILAHSRRIIKVILILWAFLHHFGSELDRSNMCILSTVVDRLIALKGVSTTKIASLCF